MRSIIALLLAITALQAAHPSWEAMEGKLTLRYGPCVVEQALQRGIIAKSGPLSPEQAYAAMEQMETLFPEEIASHMLLQLQGRLSHWKEGQERPLLEELVAKISLLQSLKARAVLLLELCKVVALTQEIPSIRESRFLEKELPFFALAVDIAHRDETLAALSAYPTTQRRSFIRFIPPLGASFPFASPPYAQKPYPAAVFKAQQGREGEVATWELSCLFGLDEVFIPAIYTSLQGERGVLQQYEVSDVSLEQSYSTSLYGWVAYPSLVRCALGVLLLALEDIHNENMYYQKERDGYFSIGLLDTVGAFKRTSFSWKDREGLPALYTPYNWIGWDYPQVEKKIPKKQRAWVAALTGSWPARANDLRAYLDHPLTTLELRAEDERALFARIDTLNAVTHHKKGKTVQFWHEAFVPEYAAASDLLTHLFPKEKASYILFRLSWYPDTVYSWLSPHKQEKLKGWICTFPQG